jgi:hypothetical protein
MSISEAQRKKDAHAGPHDSFPLDAQHVHAAWMLAGHAANPSAVRAKIKAWAKAHGMMDKLPKTAQDDDKAEDTIKKATGEDMRAVMQQTWAHGYEAGNSWMHRHLIQLAHERGLLRHLPPEAHGMMHEMGIAHEHEGIANRTDSDNNVVGAGHEHVVTKAQPKVGFIEIQKSWGADGQDCFYEGWLSTPTRDLEKDVTEPEAFIPALPSYFARRAPVSVQHGTQFLPAGHLQKAVVVRDGKVIGEASHPTDGAYFEHFPGTGSGVWVRGRLTESPARDSVRKGNCGGMSFIAMATEFYPLPGGGRRITKLNPLQETTVAPYPVNTDAQIAVAKAFGLESTAEEVHNEDDNVSVTIEELLAQALEARNAAQKTEEPEGVTKAELGALLLDFKTQIESTVAESVQKAIPARGEGAGRKGGIPAPDDFSVAARDADPLRYIAKKASQMQTDSSIELDEVDQKLVAALTWKALQEGLTMADDEDDNGFAELQKLING